MDELTVDMVQKLDVGMVCFFILAWLFLKQQKYLSGRITRLELKEEKNEMFIRDTLAAIIKEQNNILSKVNETMLHHTKEYAKLCKIIGKLGKLDKDDRPDCDD